MKASVTFDGLAAWYEEQKAKYWQECPERTLVRRPLRSEHFRTRRDKVFKEDEFFEIGGRPALGRFFTPIKTVLGWMDFQLGTLEGSDTLAEILLFVIRVNRNMSLPEAYLSIKKGHDRVKEGGIKPYRDHVVHTSVVYKLGIDLLESEVEKEPFRNTLARRIAESEMGREAIAFSGHRRPPDWLKVIDRAWLLTSFWHDVGYYLEPAFDLEEFFLDFDPPLNHRPIHCSLQAKIITALVGRAEGLSLRERHTVRGLFLKDALKALKTGRLDHGQFLSCLFLEGLYGHGLVRSLSKTDRLILFLVLVGTFRHNLWSKSRDPEEPAAAPPTRPGFPCDPWSVFFSFVDSLAEVRLVWDAPTQKPCRGGAQWRLSIWLPFESVEVGSVSGTEWRARFTIDSKTKAGLALPIEKASRNGFDFALACGADTGEEAGTKRQSAVEAKRELYQEMLTSLGLLETGGKFLVYMK